MKIATWCGVALMLVALAPGLAAGGEEKPKHKYLGASKCAKMCHKSATKGKQLVIWQKSKHAQAYKILLSDKAKETAKKLGIAAPEKSPKCLKCHTTGYNVPAEYLAGSFKVEDGVQCERCHGAGEKFAKMSVMKNPEKAAKLGRVTPDKTLCVQCHNNTAPTWDPNRFTTKDGKKVGFDYDLLWPKIAHPMPDKGKKG